MRSAGALIALTIVILAVSPGAMESYIVWHEYPEARWIIVAWYLAVTVTAIAIGTGIGGLDARRTA